LHKIISKNYNCLTFLLALVKINVKYCRKNSTTAISLLII